MKKIGPGVGRRAFLWVPLALLMACGASQTQEAQAMKSDSSPESRVQTSLKGRLESRPKPPREAGPKGLHLLGLGGARDGWIYVPESYRADRPAPLVLMLHGAGGRANRTVDGFRQMADEHDVILLVPDSRQGTWDAIRGEYGPDVSFIDRALAWTFDRYAIDLSRLAAAGFSDGATYALSIGLVNGDLFSHVIAFSPGYIAAGERRGRPRVFVSHGTRDQVLPIDRCSRRIVAWLQGNRFDVLFREFDGPHAVPEAVADEAMDWFGALQQKKS